MMAIDPVELAGDSHDRSELPVAASQINSRTSVEGTIKSSTDLRIDGLVTGAIECDGVLYVSEGAAIDATIEAGGIVVEGSLSGTILCHGRLEIRATGHVNAEVDTERLMIHEGAVYEGRLRMDAPMRGVQDPGGTDESEASAAESQPASDPYPYLRSFTASATSDDTGDRDKAEDDGDDSRS